MAPRAPFPWVVVDVLGQFDPIGCRNEAVARSVARTFPSDWRWQAMRADDYDGPPPPNDIGAQRRVRARQFHYRRDLERTYTATVVLSVIVEVLILWRWGLWAGLCSFAISFFGFVAGSTSQELRG